MITIVLFCGGGMSTSLLAAKMREAAKAEGLEVSAEAYSLSQVESIGPTADIILLGPQVRHQKDQVQAKCPDKVIEVIDMVAYGMVDGKKVIAQVKKALGV